MFRSSRTVLPRIYSSVRKSSFLPHELQTNVWKKSNIAYISYVVIAAVAIEIVYGATTNYLWESYNQGVSHLCYLIISFFSK